MRGILLASVLSLPIIAACGGPDANDPSRAQTTSGAVAGKSEDFAAKNLQGKTVRLSDYLGKNAIMIDFWSTYCQPCLAAFPHVKRIQEAYKAKGLVVLAVSMDGTETVANVPAFVQRNGIGDLNVLYDEDSQIASLYNPKKVEPFVLVFDKHGKVVKTHEGYNPGDEALFEEAVKKAVE